eukprot:TRINITY_DN2522_c0_g2_i1.p1 TRINITY_DN2522_c0_g2~~TRINITY_DN2522_c0_g2_i1.p1  ORF type:complete len:458 (+),score=98.30 TRINITY_DN2522_c0_g2_i1:172-1545(+)
MRWTIGNKRLNVAIYTSVFPPHLQVGGGCALRYYTMVKNLLKEGCKVLLFTIHNPEDVINFDPLFVSCAEKLQLVVQQIPSMTNKLYPQISLLDPKISFFQTAYNLLKEHEIRLLIVPDTCETLLILHLAKLAGVEYTVYGIHTDLFKLIVARPGILNKCIYPALLYHFFAASHSADNTSVSSKVFQDQIKESFDWKLVRVDGFFESLLWSEHFRLPLQSEEEKLYQWRCQLTQGRPESPLVLYAGRWSHEKRINLLPSALPAGWKLALIGSGPDSDCEQVLKLSNEDVYARREFLNAEDLSRAYQCSDFFVSASDFETFGFCVLEALACGTPVAVENAGGFVETVSHEENGLLLEFTKPQDVKETLLRFSPETSNYRNLKNNVLKGASKRDVAGESKFYTERLVKRHAPGLFHDLDEELVKKSRVRRAASTATNMLRWFFVLFTFLLLKFLALVFC